MLFVSVFLNMLIVSVYAEEPGDKEAVSLRTERAFKRLEKYGGRDQYVTIFSDIPEDKKSFERPNDPIVLDKGETSSGLAWRSGHEKDEWSVINKERRQRAKVTKRLIVKGTQQEIAEVYEFLKSDPDTQGIVGEKEDMVEANAAIISFSKARGRGQLRKAIKSLRQKGFKAELELLNERRFHAK